MDLWPLAAVMLCPNCRSRELFLIDDVDGDQITLRSLEEHTMQITYTGP
ncbi:hypothetical protein [Catenulispora pinisilvae]|nr:hypothetical protein [Catenulispora pinisilvae]